METLSKEELASVRKVVTWQNSDACHCPKCTIDRLERALAIAYRTIRIKSE